MTSANACEGQVAHQRATVDERGRGAADSFNEKLDTSSVCKVSYILIAVYMLIDM
jgi:hypothetical protein